MSESPEDCYDEFPSDDDDICQRCSGEGCYHDCGDDTCCCAEEDSDDLVECPVIRRRQSRAGRAER